MKTNNKRIIILTAILGILLFVWWLVVPVKFEFDKTEKLSSHWESFYIIHQSKNSPVHYTIQNIQVPISIKRYENFKYNKYPDVEWLALLQTIGHYDEALKYLEDKQYNSLIKDLSFDNELCLNRGTKTNRAKIIGCIVKSDLSDIVYFKDNRKTRLDEITTHKQMIINYKKDVYTSGKKWNKPTLYCENKKSQWQGYNCGFIPTINYFIQEGQLDEANKILTQMINEYKYNHVINDFHLRLGIEYTKRQEYQKAIPLFEKVLEHQDYNYKAHKKLAECYTKIGNHSKAIYHENIMKELLLL